MLENYSIQYYEPSDITTNHYLYQLAKDIKQDSEFVQKLVLIIENPNGSIEYYKNLLRIRVIFEYEELMPLITSELVLEALTRLYRDLNSFEVNKLSIDLKIKTYLTEHIEMVFRTDNYSMVEETYKFCLRFGRGITNWDEILEKSDREYLIHFFEDLYKVLKKDSKIIKILVESVLSPISNMNFNRQMDIALWIRSKFNSEFTSYQQNLFEYFETKEFKELSSVNQVKQLKDVLNKRFLGIKGEIYLKGKLANSEQRMRSDLNGSMHSYEVSSEEFAKLESCYSDFREKLYLLTFIGAHSFYQVMQRQATKDSGVSLLDLIGTMDGITHKKYGNAGFAIRFQNYTSVIYVNTMYLIHHYENHFWKALRELVCDVAEFSEGIGSFLIEDLIKVETLFKSKDYFLTSTFMVQILERLLRETYLKIEFGIVDVLREAKYQLGTILKTHDSSVLRKLFTEEEIETMDYFLINDEYGWNLRNRLAHYNIDSNNVSGQHCIQLIHIMIFILIKIDYQMEVYEESLN